MWDSVVEQPFVLFLWWFAIIFILGTILDRFFTLVQRVAVILYKKVSDRPQWHITIIQTLTWVARVALWCIVFVMVASRLGIPPSLITALGTVFGAALGFGAQDVVKDVVKGTVHLLEKQFSVGDFVSYTIAGVDYAGTVEDVNLRTVVINTENDGRVSVPQGAVTVVKNYSLTGSFVFSIPCEVDVDVHATLSLLGELVDDINQRNYNSNILIIEEEDKETLGHINDLVLRGVTDISAGALTIQIRGDSTPGEQFAVRRVLTKACAALLNSKGISIKSMFITGGTA